MAALAALREGIRANLAAIPGAQVSAYMLGNPTPPTLWVIPGPIEFDKASARGDDLHVLTVQCIVGAIHDIGGQKQLDKYLAGSGADSVKAAIEADKTLGGAVGSGTLRVTGATGYRPYVGPNGEAWLAAQWRVEIHASSSS